MGRVWFQQLLRIKWQCVHHAPVLLLSPAQANEVDCIKMHSLQDRTARLGLITQPQTVFSWTVVNLVSYSDKAFHFICLYFISELGDPFTVTTKPCLFTTGLTVHTSSSPLLRGLPRHSGASALLPRAIAWRNWLLPFNTGLHHPTRDSPLNLQRPIPDLTQVTHFNHLGKELATLYSIHLEAEVGKHMQVWRM